MTELAMPASPASFSAHKDEHKDEEEALLLGPRAAHEAIQSKRPIDKVWYSRPTPRLRPLIEEMQARGVSCHQVAAQTLRHLAGTKPHQGIIIRMSALPLGDLSELLIRSFEQGVPPVVLLLSGCTNVGNFGAIARSAEALGCQALVLESRQAPPLSAAAIRSSAGALLHLPICRFEGMKQAFELLRSHGIPIVAATPNAKDSLMEATLMPPVALLLGAEGSGLSAEWLAASDQQIRIPMGGKTESLNVAQAATLLLYETQRQHKNA